MRPGLCRTIGLGVDYILPLKCSISSFNWRDKFHCVQGPAETESHTETSVIHFTHRNYNPDISLSRVSVTPIIDNE